MIASTDGVFADQRSLRYASTIACNAFPAALEWVDRSLQFLPEEPALLYDKACLQALTGEPGMALESLRRSLEREPGLRARAAEDPDLESLRGRPEFVALVGPPAP